MSRKIMALLFALLFFSLSFANKETLKQGWDAFNNNKRKDALALFSKAAADADTKAQANLAMALVWWSEDKQNEAFKAFQDFFSTSDNPYPYLYALWTSPAVFDDYEKKNDAKITFLQQLVNDPKANGTIHAMAHAMLGKHYENIGEFKKADEEFSQIGSIENWQVLGTFDNTSGSGFSKSFGAVENPKPDAVFKNKVDADVRWFKPPYERNDRWFDFNYYFAINNSIMYAQTFLKSDKDQEVYFRSGNSGSLKIWVNDKLVTDVSEERNCDLDIYVNNVKLHKGYNRILVQIGESETDAANFMIRVTDKDGNLIKGLSSEAEYQDYEKAVDYPVTTGTFFAEQFFLDKIKNEPDNILNYLMLSDIYLRNDKVYEARKELKKAHELAPGSSFVGSRMIEAYARDKDVTDLTKEYEKIKSEDPDGSYALKGMIDEARDKENFDEVETLLNKYKSIYGEDEYTDLQYLNLLADRKKYDDLVKEAQRLYEKYPENFDLMNLQYNIERNTGKDLAKANQVLKNYLKNHYSDKVLTMLAGNYFDLGNKKEGYDLYNQRVQNYPYSVGYYTDLSDLYFDAQDYENSLKWALKSLELVPYVGGYWNRVGKIYEAMGRKDNAIDAYQKAIYYTPTNYEARKQLRKLQDKKDLFENFEKIDAYDLYKNSPNSDAYPDDNSLVLLNETQRVVYPEGATEERVEVLIKVFNQNGIDLWKEYSVGYNQYRQRLIIDKAEVLKKDGNKVQAEKDKGYLVFTNLEAGDAIHVSYRLENYNTGKLAQHFWEQFNFNFDYPVMISRYSLLIPADKQFKSEVLHDSKIQPVVKDIDGGMKLYVWDDRNMPAIKPEPHMPPLSDIGVILDISTIPDWKYVSNWYSDLSSSLAKGDFAIKETVAGLFKDKKNMSDLQKAKVIYDYIEANISYSNVPFMHGPLIPQKASRTLSTRLGDCKDVSTLFVAMCKEVGLKANLVLVDTRDNGLQHLNLPSIDFNHCIAELRAGGKKYYIELTDQKLSFSSIPAGDLNSNILFIPRDGDSAATQLTRLNSKSRPMNSIVRQTAVTFDNTDMDFDRHNLKIGMFASQMRNEYADIGRDKQEKEITEAIASDYTNPAKLLKLSFSDLRALTDTVTYDYSFNIKNQLTEVVGIKITKLPWSDAVRSLDFLSLENRKYPFDMWSYTGAEDTKETITVNIPMGTKLAEAPKSVSLSCSAADYSLTYNTSTPGILKAVREIHYKKDSINPDEYSQFRDFFNKVAEADSKQIGFK